MLNDSLQARSHFFWASRKLPSHLQWLPLETLQCFAFVSLLAFLWVSAWRPFSRRCLGLNGEPGTPGRTRSRDLCRRWARAFGTCSGQTAAWAAWWMSDAREGPSWSLWPFSLFWISCPWSKDGRDSLKRPLRSTTRWDNKKEGGPSAIPLDAFGGTTASWISLVQVGVQCVAQRTELQMN